MVQLCISASALLVLVLVATSNRHCPSLRACACKADAYLALLELCNSNEDEWRQHSYMSAVDAMCGRVGKWLTNRWRRVVFRTIF